MSVPLEGVALLDGAPLYYYPLILTTRISGICILAMLVCIVVDVLYFRKVGQGQVEEKAVTICREVIPAACIRAGVILVALALWLGVSYICCNHLYSINQVL